MKQQTELSQQDITTAGMMRLALAKAMRGAADGTLPAGSGKTLIGLSNQISHSAAVEMKYRTMEKALGHECGQIGSMPIG